MNRTYFSQLLLLAFCLAVIIGCSSKEKPEDQSQETTEINTNDKKVNTGMKEIVCTSLACLENNKNKSVTVEGTFREYVPTNAGKGAGEKLWDWEILLDDGAVVPGVNLNKSEDLSVYIGKRVSIESNLFYGKLTGSGSGQSATGFRVDMIAVSET